MNKIIISIMALMMCTLVFAANGNPNGYMSQNQNEIAKMQQHQNMFQERYNFTCQEECNYGLNDKGKVTLQIKETKMFLFWELIAESNLILNEEGEPTEFAQNLWARLFGIESLDI